MARLLRRTVGLGPVAARGAPPHCTARYRLLHHWSTGHVPVEALHLELTALPSSAPHCSAVQCTKGHRILRSAPYPPDPHRILRIRTVSSGSAPYPPDPHRILRIRTAPYPPDPHRILRIRKIQDMSSTMGNRLRIRRVVYSQIFVLFELFVDISTIAQPSKAQVEQSAVVSPIFARFFC
jgi:hypothetical protein